MDLQQIPTGGDRNYGYLILHQDQALIVDPGEDPSALKSALESSGASLRWIVATHGHADHVAGMAKLKKECGGRTVASALAGCPVDESLASVQALLPLGDAKISLLPTPGHTPCSLCVLLPAHGDTPAQLVSGDTLFVGKIGGTATEEEARTEYHSLHEVLLKLDDSTLVWPGHNYGQRPSSSIGAERRENPFLIQPDFAAFIYLKQNWAAYKAEHGIS